MESEYEALLRREALPAFSAHPGVACVRLGLPAPRTPHEFLVETVWKSQRDLERFVGKRFLEPRVSPGERHLLEAASVHHYADDGAPEGLREPTPSLGNATAVLDVGRLSLDLHRSVAHVDGEPVELPPREFALLLELALRAGQPVSAADLAFRVWPGSVWMTGDDVRRVVHRLRRAIHDDERVPPLLRNRRGYGYILDA